MARALAGEFGVVYTSDYVVDEAITTALARTKRLELAIDIGEFVLASPRIVKLRVSEDVFKAAWNRFKSLGDRFLSFTDCITLALMEKHGIESIASFNSGFDGPVKRIA
jgi:predicted nucleic acid-binding protein